MKLYSIVMALTIVCLHMKDGFTASISRFTVSSSPGENYNAHPLNFLQDGEKASRHGRWSPRHRRESEPQSELLAPPQLRTPADTLDKVKNYVQKIVQELSKFNQKFTLRLIRLNSREDLKEMPELMKDFEISQDRPIFFIAGGLKMLSTDATTSITTTSTTTTTTTEVPVTSTILTSTTTTEALESSSDLQTDSSRSELLQDGGVETYTSFETNSEIPSTTSDYESTTIETKSTTHIREEDEETHQSRRKRSVLQMEELTLSPRDLSIPGRMARTENPFEDEFDPYHIKEVRHIDSIDFSFNGKYKAGLDEDKILETVETPIESISTGTSSAAVNVMTSGLITADNIPTIEDAVEDAIPMMETQMTSSKLDTGISLDQDVNGPESINNGYDVQDSNALESVSVVAAEDSSALDAEPLSSILETSSSEEGENDGNFSSAAVDNEEGDDDSSVNGDNEFGENSEPPSDDAIPYFNQETSQETIISDFQPEPVIPIQTSPVQELLSSPEIPLETFQPQELSPEIPLETFQPQQFSPEIPLETFQPQQFSPEVPLETFQPQELSPEIPLETFQPQEFSPEVPLETFQPQQLSPEIQLETLQPQELSPEIPLETFQPQQFSPEIPLETFQPQEQLSPEVPLETFQPQQLSPEVPLETFQPQQFSPEISLETFQPQEQLSPEISLETFQPQQFSPEISLETFQPQEFSPEVPLETFQPQEQLPLEIPLQTFPSQENISPELPLEAFSIPESETFYSPERPLESSSISEISSESLSVNPELQSEVLSSLDVSSGIILPVVLTDISGMPMKQIISAPIDGSSISGTNFEQMSGPSKIGQINLENSAQLFNSNVYPKVPISSQEVPTTLGQPVFAPPIAFDPGFSVLGQIPIFQHPPSPSEYEIIHYITESMDNAPESNANLPVIIYSPTAKVSNVPPNKKEHLVQYFFSIFE